MEEISQTTRAKPSPQYSGEQKQSMKAQRDDDDVTKTGHTLEVAANEEGELAQSSVVPWPFPPSTNQASIHSDTKHTNIHTDKNINKINDDTKMTTDLQNSIEMRDEDMWRSGLNKDTHTKKSDSPKMNSLNAQTHTPDCNQLKKDQQLQEEERFLLAKIHLMTGDTLPVSCPRKMKLLIPDPHDIDCDTTELVDHSQHLIISCCDNLQEISLAEAEEPLANELRQNQEGEEGDV